MLLTGSDGSRVEAHIVGYESPNGHDNWLLVAIRVTTPDGAGESIENCWQIEEVRRLIVWFTAIAEGLAVQSWGGNCLEATLEFTLVAESLETATILASFILERGLWYPRNGQDALSDYRAHIDVVIPRTDLRNLVRELDDELRRFPPREPERPLPSPLR
jgi:hypothetical protein